MTSATLSVEEAVAQLPHELAANGPESPSSAGL